jgi:phage baseplate assembly protein W
MNHKISPNDPGKITLNENDAVASILQNLAVLLSTRQGTVPLYRGFGLPMLFVDKPMPVAKVMMIAEIEEAVRLYEPRASVVGVTFEADKNIPGRLIPTMEVEINDAQES